MLVKKRKTWERVVIGIKDYAQHIKKYNQNPLSPFSLHSKNQEQSIHDSYLIQDTRLQRPTVIFTPCHINNMYISITKSTFPTSGTLASKLERLLVRLKEEPRLTLVVATLKFI